MRAHRLAFSIRETQQRQNSFHVKDEGKPRPHSGGERRSSFVFGAGDIVRETGIYEVIHDAAHRSAHEVVMLSSDAFPACETCGQRVRFRLIRTAPYIFQDEDFGE